MAEDEPLVPPILTVPGFIPFFLLFAEFYDIKLVVELLSLKVCAFILLF
jgi:hypothetical protein